MAEYNLFDRAQGTLMLMVKAVEEKGCNRSFTIARNSMFRGLLFDGDAGQHEQVECKDEDLLDLAREGLVELESRGGGSITKAGVDAVHNNFQRPYIPTAASVIHQIFQGAVTNNQIGNHNTANIQQNITNEAITLIQECRGQLDTVNEADRQHAGEFLDDLEGEIKTGAPKQSKVLSYIKSVASYATAGTALVGSLAKLAHACHIDPTTIESIFRHLM